MRLALALALTLAADPAVACHRFSVWRFPYPQRCGVAHVQRVASLLQATPPLKPVLDEDAARAQAIKTLKLILGGNQ
jgi:hypothetical protein